MKNIVNFINVTENPEKDEAINKLNDMEKDYNEGVKKIHDMIEKIEKRIAKL